MPMMEFDFELDLGSIFILCLLVLLGDVMLDSGKGVQWSTRTCDLCGFHGHWELILKTLDGLKEKENQTCYCASCA